MARPSPGRTLRWLHDRPLTARRAGQLIGVYTVGVSILGAVAIRVFDPDEFPNIWLSLWWSVQTVTTVGYGDITPRATVGRAIAAVVMVSGIGFLTVVTAAITAVFLEGERRELKLADDARDAGLANIAERLDRIEEALGVPGRRPQPPPGR